MTQAPINSLTVASTGFRVDASIAGGASKTGETQLGTITFYRTGHGRLSTAGLQAILSHISTYFGTLGPILLEYEACSLGVFGGQYSCQNTDLATEQGSIFTILATAANVIGPA